MHTWEPAMDWIRVLLSRCVALVRKQRLDQDLDEELCSHIDFAVEENLKRRKSAEAARTAALKEFGGMTQTKESYRVQRGLPFLETVANDLRFGLRQLDLETAEWRFRGRPLCSDLPIFGISSASPTNRRDQQERINRKHQ
jgi:hypothetical protein